MSSEELRSSPVTAPTRRAAHRTPRAARGTLRAARGALQAAHKTLRAARGTLRAARGTLRTSQRTLGGTGPDTGSPAQEPSSVRAGAASVEAGAGQDPLGRSRCPRRTLAVSPAHTRGVPAHTRGVPGAGSRCPGARSRASRRTLTASRRTLAAFRLTLTASGLTLPVAANVVCPVEPGVVDSLSLIELWSSLPQRWRRRDAGRVPTRKTEGVTPHAVSPSEDRGCDPDSLTAAFRPSSQRALRASFIALTRRALPIFENVTPGRARVGLNTRAISALGMSRKPSQFMPDRGRTRLNAKAIQASFVAVGLATLSKKERVPPRVPPLRFSLTTAERRLAASNVGGGTCCAMIPSKCMTC